MAGAASPDTDEEALDLLAKALPGREIVGVPGLTVFAVPHFFQPGHIRTSFASPMLMFMATAPPRDKPTTTWGRCLSNSACAMRTASAKSSSGSAGLMTSWPCWAR